jgi:GNAT superfamily N-acetyltransferase
LSAAWVGKQWVHVALLDAEVVGVFAVTDEAGQWKLEHLWVDPTAMGKGVGRAMIVAACELARGCGANELTISADPNAAGFYIACGAVLVGETPAPTEGEPSRKLPVFRLSAIARATNMNEGNNNMTAAMLPQSPLIIRTLASGEWPLYREIRLRSLADAPDAFCSKLASEEALDPAVWAARTFAAAASNLDRPLIAEIDGVVAGLLWAKIYPDKPSIVNIFQVWVAPESRGHGVAAALLDDAIAWARTKNAHAVLLSVTCGDTPAARLYARAGFKNDGPPTPREHTAQMEQSMLLALQQ